MGVIESTLEGEPDQDARYRAAVENYGSSLDRLARAYEADPEKRRDLVQDIHFQLWRSLAGYDSLCSLWTWVSRVAHHVAVSYVMRERRTFSKLVSLEELESIQAKDDDQTGTSWRITVEQLSALINGSSHLIARSSFLIWKTWTQPRSPNHGLVSGKRLHADLPD